MLNQVNLVGVATSLPIIMEIDGTPIARLTVETRSVWNDPVTNEPFEIIDLHKVVFRGGLVENIRNIIGRDSMVAITGSLHTRRFENPGSGDNEFISEVNVHSYRVIDQRNQLTVDPMGDIDLNDITGLVEGFPNNEDVIVYEGATYQSTDDMPLDILEAYQNSLKTEESKTVQ